MKLYLKFVPADLWVGAYWDGKKRRLYICVLPTLPLVFDLGEKPTHQHHKGGLYVEEQVVTLTDDARAGDLLTVYHNSAYGSAFARPAEMFNDHARFRPLVRE